MVRISRKESTFVGITMKEDIVNAIPFDYEENLEGVVREKSGSEVTVMAIYNFRN